jgi:hypothetical protein
MPLPEKPAVSSLGCPPALRPQPLGDEETLIRYPDTDMRFLICPPLEPGAVRVLPGGGDLRVGAGFWWLWARIRQPARSGWGFVQFDL